MTTIERPRGPLVTTYDRETCTRVIVIDPDAAPWATRAAPDPDVEPANAKAPPAADPPPATPADGEPPTSVAALPETVWRAVAPDTTETAGSAGEPPEDVLRTADDAALVAEAVVFVTVLVTDETAPDAAFVTVVTTAGGAGAGAGLGAGGGWMGAGGGGGGGCSGGGLIGTVVETVGTGTGVVTVGAGADVVGRGSVGSPSASAPPATAPPPSSPSAVSAAAALTRF